MSTRTKYLIAGFGLFIITIGAVWWFVFRDDAPPAVSLTDAVASATTTVAGTDPTVASNEVPEPTPGLDGTWIVDTTQDSFVGYRVQEELVNIGAKTAVGRTPVVTGTIEFAGTVMSAATLEADLTQLKSDDSRRDGQLGRQAIETDTFPTATFTATQPVDLGQIPAAGTPFMVEAVGDLTLHGVTRSVTVPIEGQLLGESVVIVGGIDIVFADYDIEPPTSFAVLSVADIGEMEFQLFLAKS